MGDQNEFEGADADGTTEHLEKRPAFSSNRRTAWSRNSNAGSSWNVGSKDYRPRRAANGRVREGDEKDGTSARDESNFSGNFHQHTREATVHVQKGKKAFEVEASVLTEAHPDSLYNLITDFENTAKVYSNVDRVEVEDRGAEKLVRQYLHWSFLAWSGEYSVAMKMRSNPETRSISYNLDQQGFLKVFKGSWKVEPVAVDGMPPVSRLVIQQEVLPSFMPPGPLGTYAAKIMKGQVRSLLDDVAKEASSRTKPLS